MYVFDPTTSTLTPVKNGEQVGHTSSPQTGKGISSTPPQQDVDGVRRALSSNRTWNAGSQGEAILTEDQEAVKNLLALESHSSSEKENYAD